MKKSDIIRILAATLFLTLLYWIAGWVFGNISGSKIHIFSLVSNLLVCLLLGYYIRFTNKSFWQLSFSVFLIYYLIGHFNLYVEAYIFNVTTRSETLFENWVGLVISAIISPILVWLFMQNDHSATNKREFRTRNIFQWVWRILVSDIIYLLFYIGAGLTLSIALPKVIAFYDGKLPSMDLMIYTQLFLRGFVFTLVAIIIVRSMNQNLLKRSVFVGVVFAVLGAVAPLLPPSELMPQYVRLGHGIEVSISNFLFGLTISWLLGQPFLREPLVSK